MGPGGGAGSRGRFTRREQRVAGICRGCRWLPPTKHQLDCRPTCRWRRTGRLSAGHCGGPSLPNSVSRWCCAAGDDSAGTIFGPIASTHECPKVDFLISMFMRRSLRPRKVACNSPWTIILGSRCRRMRRCGLHKQGLSPINGGHPPTPNGLVTVTKLAGRLDGTGRGPRRAVSGQSGARSRSISSHSQWWIRPCA